GSKSIEDVGQQALRELHPRVVCGIRLHREVEREAVAIAITELVHEPRSRKEIPAGLVDREGEHLRIIVEEALSSVAVMCVVVDIEHTRAVLPTYPGDRHGEVVVDAEARGTIPVRVV